MKEINGIVYADEHVPSIGIIEAIPLPDMMMILTFNNGDKRLYDATQLLYGAVFQKLKDETIFNNPIIDSGVVTWDNGNIDVAPESMYANSFEYNQRDILTA